MSSIELLGSILFEDSMQMEYNESNCVGGEIII